MSVNTITASIQCDDCGKNFRVSLDESARTPEGWTLFELAEDAVRGGVSTVDPIGQSTSVQDGMMLCPTCTRERDIVATRRNRDL